KAVSEDADDDRDRHHHRQTVVDLQKDIFLIPEEETRDDEHSEGVGGDDHELHPEGRMSDDLRVEVDRSSIILMGH
ncbi:hypothetical protein PENTCL1PPCAC_28840, partial [Pristionchus entomophagus]